ncbi:MAG: DUF2975 domain-containing protein [Eubacteriaceae bacterium]
MYKNSPVHYLTKIIVDILFYSGILCCLTLPFLIRFFVGYEYFQIESIILYLILFPSGICAVFILWQLKAIFKTMLNDNPFVKENIICLRKMGVASFLISIIYLIKIIFNFEISSGIIFVVFAIATLFCLTLKDVFKQAVAYKEENDWTV